MAHIELTMPNGNPRPVQSEHIVQMIGNLFGGDGTLLTLYVPIDYADGTKGYCYDDILVREGAAQIMAALARAKDGEGAERRAEEVA